jgi:hypothetical protein
MTMMMVVVVVMWTSIGLGKYHREYKRFSHKESRFL